MATEGDPNFRSARNRALRLPEGLALKPDPPAFSFRKRADAFRCIVREPGITLPELASRLAVPVSSLRHHLGILERDRLIRSEPFGRRRSLFAADLSSSEDAASRALLTDESARRIIGAILDEHVQSVAHLVELTSLSPRVVYYHAKKLLDADLITTQSITGYRRLRPTSKLYALLAGTLTGADGES